MTPFFRLMKISSFMEIDDLIFFKGNNDLSFLGYVKNIDNNGTELS
jgi:hypothetical protein